MEGKIKQIYRLGTNLHLPVGLDEHLFIYMPPIIYVIRVILLRN
jgi:hypothetical protein